MRQWYSSAIRFLRCKWSGRRTFTVQRLDWSLCSSDSIVCDRWYGFGQLWYRRSLIKSERLCFVCRLTCTLRNLRQQQFEKWQAYFNWGNVSVEEKVFFGFSLLKTSVIKMFEMSFEYVAKIWSVFLLCCDKQDVIIGWKLEDTANEGSET